MINLLHSLKSFKLVSSLCFLNFDAFRYKTWTNERAWADEILKAVRQNGLEVKLDDLTKGDGNCFMISTTDEETRCS